MIKNKTSMIRTRLVLECPFCHITDVELIWKEYLKQYRGMCPNEACEVWSVVKEVKFYKCYNKKKQISCSHYVSEKCDHECHSKIPITRKCWKCNDNTDDKHDICVVCAEGRPKRFCSKENNCGCNIK